MDAKWVKEYSWKAAITNLFETEILHGDVADFTGLFEATNFDNNMKSVNKAYQEHVLNVGEFDEKIFLGKFFFSSVSFIPFIIYSTADTC